MKRFWVSWCDAEQDYRPLHDPPVLGILGWWCSGETCDEPTRYTIVAWVEAADESAARALLAADWPETQAAEFRFVDEVERSWRPSDRFPLASWTETRIA